MLKIDKNIFNTNLRLTQEYCRIQMDGKQKDNAKIFRSFNPIENDKPFFTFKVEKFDFEIEPNLNSCTLTKWWIDPCQLWSKNIVNRLFTEQQTFKATHSTPYYDRNYKGDILVSQVDCTVLDGASEVQSLGLIDIYDLPPIDTWFYLTKNKDSRLLFSWIPHEFMHYANEGIAVNCVDCFNWFRQEYPDDYNNLVNG